MRASETPNAWITTAKGKSELPLVFNSLHVTRHTSCDLLRLCTLQNWTKRQTSNCHGSWAPETTYLGYIWKCCVDTTLRLGGRAGRSAGGVVWVHCPQWITLTESLPTTSFAVKPQASIFTFKVEWRIRTRQPPCDFSPLPSPLPTFFFFNFQMEVPFLRAMPRP